jgi:hypothetical protein
MRNIIDWASPNDMRFAPRLSRRVSRVIAPLVREKTLEAERAQLVTTFDGRSQLHKRDWLIATALGHFNKLDYTVTRPGEDQGDNPQIVEQMPHELRSGLAAIRQTRQNLRFVFFHVIPSVTANLCNAYRFSLIFHPFYNLRLFRPPRVVPKDIYEDIIVCSMQTGSLRRLRSNLSMLHVGDTEGTLRYDVVHPLPRREQDVRAARHLTFHILDTSAKLVMLPDYLKERFSRRVADLPTQSSYTHHQQAAKPLRIRPMTISIRVRRPS